MANQQMSEKNGTNIRFVKNTGSFVQATFGNENSSFTQPHIESAIDHGKIEGGFHSSSGNASDQSTGVQEEKI